MTSDEYVALVRSSLLLKRNTPAKLLDEKEKEDIDNIKSKVYQQHIYCPFRIGISYIIYSI